MLSERDSDVPTPPAAASVDREPANPDEDSRTQEALTERDQAILDFERQWWSHAGAKEEAIRTQLGLSAARYYQLLGALIDSPLALAADPMLVKRLQRMRQSRAEARSRRSLGTTPTHPTQAGRAGTPRPPRTESD